ncbi:MMPL family transporter [Siccirubricoccus sp. KC 17139]|uniref:MMPL family transporter n=1 Tax=Siccirubricoccus soli TaxID=2899147 RepID=A0ABT1D9Z2_9PROT|nr:MMPL family transporter [Siccirubricoccus soli]MCO6418004.1 MMPL family transporter [Siccirubricoccus soli]MCP2684139.1 MMPL family transporter [Siccirubricoccus soli]
MTRLLLLLAVLAGLGGVLGWLAPPRADLAEFLPPGRTPASAFLLRELQSGAATTLLLAAIEGAPRAELARLSRETAAGLRASGRFGFVGDGSLRLEESEQALLFRYRYLLSPETRPEAFTAAALRPKLEALLDGLRSAASPLLARYGFADPTGAFLGLAAAWLGESHVAAEDGAWFAPGEVPRVLLVARGQGAGLDAEAQRLAIAAFRAAFAAARPPPGARLLLSGPGVFAAEAAATIERDVRRLTLLATLLLAGFLVWRFRSLAVLALVAVPLLAATLAGYAAVVALYGSVHAIALGFGVTMLGVVVDYPILLLTLRRRDEPLGAAATRIWPTLRLSAVAAAAGLLAMVGSGLPGLVQTGIFAGAGLLVAAATTRWLLPRLVPEEARLLARPMHLSLATLRGRPLPALAVLAAAAAVLLATGGPDRQRDLAALSPVPAAQQALDAELRGQLGAPDVRSLFVIGPMATEGEMLQRAEALGAAAQALVARGLLTGLDLPSRYLPSPALQASRQAALPEEATLAAALREAAAGLPFRPTAFDRFIAAVAESRGLQPLDLATLAAGAPTIAARLSPLVSRHGAEIWGIAPATGVADPAALEAGAAGLGLPSVLFLDVKLELERLLAAYGRATLGWALAGAGVVLGLLVLGLGRFGRALVVAAPIGGAVLITLAVLTLLGEALSLFHLAALLLLAGLAIDYALFLAAGRATPGEAREDATEDATQDTTLGAVLTCAVSTLLTFGMLSLSETPVLHGIGLTVTIGVAAAFLLACAFSPRGPQRRPGRGS